MDIEKIRPKYLTLAILEFKKKVSEKQRTSISKALSRLFSSPFFCVGGSNNRLWMLSNFSEEKIKLEEVKKIIENSKEYIKIFFLEFWSLGPPRNTLLFTRKKWLIDWKPLLPCSYLYPYPRRCNSFRPKLRKQIQKKLEGKLGNKELQEIVSLLSFLGVFRQEP